MTAKVFALAPNEHWICDRFVDEWNAKSSLASRDPLTADVIWLLSDWTWRSVPRGLLARKKVVTTIHHIVPAKFDANAQRDFIDRDSLTDVYHVTCELTANQIRALTTKPIVVQPFWVNQEIWYRNKTDRVAAEHTYALPHGAFLIGSFQRDTEGHDLVSPKLEKGPDIFCDAVEKIAQKKRDVMVVLAGWRRQYVMNRLSCAKIPYRLFELPSTDVIRDLYCALDLYVVGARFEGGPQAIVECAAMRVPCVSTPVGLAEKILHPCSIGHDISSLVPDTQYAFDAVAPLLIANGGMRAFNHIFERVCDAD